MNRKMIFKIVVDCLMTILLLLLMAHQLTVDAAHEWFGAGMFVLFIMHNLLNWKWYRVLLKGKYNAFRIFQTIVNILVFAAMIGLMISGIMLSRYVFAFLPISGGMSFARKLHLLSSHWAFALMSMHLGLHWTMMIRMVRKLTKINSASRFHIIELRTTGGLIALYGLYAFVKRKIADYLLLRNMYEFWDYKQSAVLFFIDYLTIMGLFIFSASYVQKLFQKCSNKK
jgi:hypothetical protein